jgi:hypothetical protein
MTAPIEAYPLGNGWSGAVVSLLHEGSGQCRPPPSTQRVALARVGFAFLMLLGLIIFMVVGSMEIEDAQISTN